MQNAVSLIITLMIAFCVVVKAPVSNAETYDFFKLKRDRQCELIDDWLSFTTEIKVQYEYRLMGKFKSPNQNFKIIYRPEVLEEIFGFKGSELDKKQRKLMAKLIRKCQKGNSSAKSLLSPFTWKPDSAAFKSYFSPIDSRNWLKGLQSMKRERLMKEAKSNIPESDKGYWAGQPLSANDKIRIYTRSRRPGDRSNFCYDRQNNGSGLSLSAVVPKAHIYAFRTDPRIIESEFLQAAGEAVYIHCGDAQGHISFYLEGLHFRDNAQISTAGSFGEHESSFFSMGFNLLGGSFELVGYPSGPPGTGGRLDLRAVVLDLAFYEDFRERGFKTESDVERVAKLRQQYNQRSAGTPFSGIDAGYYFNLLYLGDFAKLRQEDLAFIQPQLDTWIADNAQTSVSQREFKASFDRISDLMKKSSAVSIILNTYMRNFERFFGNCLRDDAVKLRHIVKYRPGYTMIGGMAVPNYLPPDHEHDYRINPEFEKVFRQYGLDNPESPLGLVLSPVMHNAQKENYPFIFTAHELRNGTHQLMKKFDCNDPIIQTLESNMLNYIGKVEAL